MAKISSTTKVPTSIEKYSDFNLNSVHVTTSNWFDISVAKAMEMPPKSGIDISQSTLARLEPIVAPTYGRGNIYNRAFFVPYRTICPYWDDFYNETPHYFNSISQEYGASYQIPEETPQIFNRTFVSFFQGQSSSRIVDEIPVTDVTPSKNITDILAERAVAYDFVSFSGTETFYVYKFTTYGKKCFNILTQLGYKIIFIDGESTSITHCALPLLALCKVYLDWFFPQQYIQDSRYLSINQLLEFNQIDFQNEFDNANYLNDIFNVILTSNYDSDFYTSIWDNPNTPNTGASLNVSIPIPVGAPGVNEDDAGRVEYEQGSDPQLYTSTIGGGITKFGLSMLSKFSDYLKKNQLAGSRSIDRFLARFGVKLPAEALKRSLHLNTNSQSVIFGDVTSTADTDGAYLGQYGGKGISYDDNTLPVIFETNEYGMFIIISTIIPDVSYYQGADMSTTRRSRLEYFEAKFDNLGTEAISLRNVYVPENYGLYQDPLNNTRLPSSEQIANKVFGFSPRYWSYKIPRDVLSGDFNVNSIGVGKDSWHLFRNLNLLYGNKGFDNITHNVSLVSSGDKNQYNRIFFVENNDVDHFNIVHTFDIKFKYPGHTLYESIDFDDMDKSEKVTVDVGATKMN